MFLIFDTETTGLPKKYNAPVHDLDNWPRLVQLAWQVHDEKGQFIKAQNLIIRPEGFEIPYSAEKVHRISTQKALEEGVALEEALKEFANDVSNCRLIVGHNIQFDLNILQAEYLRTDIPNKLQEIPFLCTEKQSTDFCKLPGGKGKGYKWPKLFELHQKLFGEDFDEAHNASADVVATARCFLELIRRGVLQSNQLNISPQEHKQFMEENPSLIQPVEIDILPNDEQNDIQSDDESGKTGYEDETANNHSTQTDDDIPFTHLHVHTQYSILDGAADIKELITKAKEYGMKALAITDHGNMFGAKRFHKTAIEKGIKPILGCEVYVARRKLHSKKDKIDAGGDHLILLAKNKTGYQNLIKMISISWLEGFYYNPRIDKTLLEKYHEGIIATSACLGGEVASKIMDEGIEAGEAAILYYKGIFNDDFYLELMRHQTDLQDANSKVYEDQVFVNNALIDIARKQGIKVIATNDVHFIKPEDAEAQDRLLCISTGKDVNDPKRMRYTKQEWFKSPDEMRALFADIPEAIHNTEEVAGKIEKYKLDQDPIMPEFVIPESFSDANEYLKHLSYEGARERWGGITPEIDERLEFELSTIAKMGFPSYFLIVWDFLKAAREMGVSVGPGRGSAAGSAVAYCLRITEIDPLRYNLLFERFLNPDRISMPDIDIDFDEDGREKVLEWVVNKYGAKRVAHIITFGTMAAKSSIRDVARVQGLPLPDADKLAKLVPEKPGTSLKKAFKEVKALKDAKESGNQDIASVLKYAETLEGSVRNIGTHACGVIIGREDLENYIPITTAKDSELTYVTQYDGKHVEDVGLLKMDFLGLKTLSIIKDAVENVQLSRGIELDIENVPLDDARTYELYSRGETTGLFQFESDGMKKYLKELKPTQFEDLIAMNALYRPGPMEYIPEFIKRKHGKAKIKYDFPIMEEVLEETYGITVYQEQVMLLSQKLAGFTGGQADSLRKAMGKKIHSMMDDLKPKFFEGCKQKHGLEERKVLKVWEDWEKFASYAFNKSHATCYSYVSYQTAYLKANYPSEFMAAVLSRNLNDIKKVTFFMEECRRMGIKVLGPDVNESHARFMVNKEGHIRFGLAAIKGVGQNAVENIVNEREKNGPYQTIFDFMKRIDLHITNRKTLESLTLAGGFDCFEDIRRHQFFAENEKGQSFIEVLIKYGSKMQMEKNGAPTLFGDTEAIKIQEPKIPDAEVWSPLYILNQEKECIGFYISAHPLDEYKFELDHFCTNQLNELNDLEKLKDKEMVIGGMVIHAVEKFAKNGKPYGDMTLEDYSGSYLLRMFSKDYLNFKAYFQKGYYLLLHGKVQERGWGNSNELELKIKQISMLSDAMDDKVKCISLDIPLTEVTESFINEMEEVTDKNKGKVMLKFNVFDPEEKMGVQMFSRNHRINLTKNFIEYLEEKPEIKYHLKS